MSKRYQCHVSLLFVWLLALVGISAVGAQDTLLEEQPLMQMLARIPNTTLARTEIYFNDKQAVETAYPDTRVPESFAEFVAANDANGEDPDLMPIELWWRVWRNQASAISARYMQLGDETMAAMGLDYFQIDQEMTYGTPPNQSMQLAGNFDLNKVRAAYMLRGYVAQEGDVELLCPEAGCDTGSKTNLADRNPANLFGGDLGRSQPVLIADGALISSPSEVAMNDNVDVITGDEQSLADLPQYRAAAAAITSEGTLLQAYFWDGELLLSMNQFSPAALILGEQATPELIKRFYEDLLKDYVELPPYQLMTFADVATETEQMGQVALVYTTEEAANTAAEVIPARIDTYESIAVRRSLREILDERRVAEPVIRIVEHEGAYVVLVSFPTPKATGETLLQFDVTSPVQPDVTPPGLIYRLLIDGAMRRDLGWLNTVPRSTIEALAGQ
ncbi:MAG: hypothetical protein LCI00_09215 [Chloroflexi bacterium]|nr:hypothetical protein [Chloroflexota bacterium]MCC6893097.1 hypothetical protein [Anaerolineae bacterium]